MDISGPIRVLLAQFLGASAGHEPDDALTLFAHLAAFPSFSPSRVPAFLEATAPAILATSAAAPRPIHAQLAFASALRMVPRMPRNFREEISRTLTAQAQSLADAAQKLLASRGQPVDLLWHYWLLVLAQKQLRLPAQDLLLKALWQRAWSGGVGRRTEGLLHPITGDAALDTVVYHDLCALHAAYNAILLTQDFDLFPPVQRLADWHVANTQPDHITNEPWALAAFASLDGTGTFAPQQLHDTTAYATAHGATPVVLALLADALAAQEDVASF